MAKSRLEGSKNRRKSKPDNLKNVETPEEESDISDTDKFSDDEEGGIRIDDIYIPPAPPPVCSYESSGPRLIITQIVNENFKSYAGRVVVGPFDKSFSSIVGPNGSGKSNVIDSMLFVFGYRATKIRSKKVSVLIHKSERHQNVSSCKVEVHFVQITDQENGQYEKIPNSEFVISRTAFQNSSSFYEINNKRVQFKEVAMTLRKHGIDLIHNRFLILQGEVEQIALMKPKAQHPHETGMLEYLEDIIGTTRFKEPLEKLQARIETLNEERQEKLNRLKVVESEREALRGPMQETVDFLKTENRITSLKNKKFQLQLYKIQKLIDETENEKSEVEGVLKSLNDKLKELQDQKGNEKSEMDAIKKFLNKTTKKYEEFGALKQNAEKKNTGLLEEGKQLKKNYKKTLENLNTEEDKLKTLLKVPEKNQKEIKKLTEEEVVLDEKRQEEEAAFQTVMSSLQKETKNFQEEKDKLQTEQIKLKKKYDEMRSAYELAKSERDIYTSSEQTEKAKLDQLVQKLNEMKETLETREKELADLKKILPQKESEYQRAEERLKAIKTKATEITSNLRKHQSQLEEKKCSMSANRSRSRVLDYLMRLKMEGKIPGIFGRLGDLGAIDEKYDIAVSTACFSLDYILVDHSDTIAPCVEALKRDGVGRATFLALNKISHHYHNQKKSNFKAPESVHRLFDLIRVEDERVLPAFYYALRNTLVANNLEQASRIAYGSTRHRVVTLMGELIEVSGTMSGGGKQVMKGKMGSSVSVSTDTYSAEEINDLERTVGRMEECLQDCRQMEQSTEEIIRTVGPEINAMKMNTNKWTIEIQGLSKQVPELETQVKDQKKKVKDCAPNAKKLKELSDKVDLTEKGARKAEIEASVIEEQVNAVHEKIMEITGGKTKEAQGKLDEVTKKWEKTRTTITQLQVAIKTSERNAKKAQERIDNMKTELEEAEKREKEIQKEKETVENDCKMASDKMEELKTEIDENTEKLKELEEEHKNYMQEVNNVKASKVKEEQKLEGIEKKLAETKRDIPTVQAKLEKLSLHKIPVFREPENEFVEENTEGSGSNDVQQPVEETELINYEEEALSQISSSEINANLQREEEYLKTLTPNLNTLKDYEKKTLQYMERSDELKEITERRNICRRGYDEARKNRLEEFMSGFSIISNKLKELYQMLTMGGDAELDLQDSLDPFTEGINFCVRPPKKSWKNITNLSGGEKTLSSLALVFALHYYRPTPLYVMDEIDAALDFKNVSIVGYYIKERTKNAQFIVISLRTNMFELAHMLTGIFKISNCTKTITICPDNYCKKPDVSPPKASESSVPPAAKNTLNTRKRSSNCFKEVEQKSGMMPLDPKSSENVSPPKTLLTKEAKKLKPRTAKKSLELNDETNRNESDLHSNDAEKRDERKKRVRESSASSEESNKENKSDGFDPLDIDCDPNESELLRQDKENRSRSSRHI